MKKRLVIITCISLAVIMVGFSVFMGIRFHVPRNPTYAQTDCGNFRLYISVESTRVRRRQGLEVTVTFKNLTGEEVPIIRGIELVRFNVVGSDLYPGGTSLEGVVELFEKDEVRESTVKIGRNLRRGAYQLHAFASFEIGAWDSDVREGVKVISNTITIRVL